MAWTSDLQLGDFFQQLATSEVDREDGVCAQVSTHLAYDPLVP